MFPTYAPLGRLVESTDLGSSGLPPLVAILVVLVLLILKDATGGVTDRGAKRLASGLTIAVLPLTITFFLIAGVQLFNILR